MGTEEETNVNLTPEEVSKLEAEGQGGSLQGQPDSTEEVVELTEEELLELPGGDKVTLEELKAGYMKDADYRRKTSDVARERESVQRERERAFRELTALTQGQIEPEEVDPVQILNQRIVGLETAYARNYLSSEIERKARDFPDADKESVFNLLWSNPNGNIEDEMRKSHERTSNVRGTISVDELAKKDPKKYAEMKKKIIEEYNAKKQFSQGAGTGGGGKAGGGSTFVEPQEKAKSYTGAGDRLKARLAETPD
jgi:hypothetical protein